MKVITIGGATRDLFLRPIDTSCTISYNNDAQEFRLSSPKDKIGIQNIIKQSGGGATNSAVAFARLGITTTCIASIGNDNEGNALRTELETEKINTTQITQHDNFPTGESFVIHQSPGGRHILFVDRGANEKLDLTALNKETIAVNDLAYITSLGQLATSQLLDFCSQATLNNVKIAHNPGQWELTKGIEHLKSVLPFLEILIVNHQEARQLEASLHSKEISETLFEPDHFFTSIHNYGVQTVVVTNGKHGVHVSQKERHFFYPSIPADVVNAVGAGDSFGSVFSASIIQNHTIESSLIRGLLSSKSVIEQIGAKKGLLTKEELDKQFQNFDSNLLR